MTTLTTLVVSNLEKKSPLIHIDAMPMLTIAHALPEDVVFLLKLFCAFEDLRGTFQDLCSRLLTLAMSGQHIFFGGGLELHDAKCPQSSQHQQ